MNGLIILIILIFLAAICLLVGKSSHEKKTREEFLRELADFLEGTLEPMDEEAYPNSFKIQFNFSGKEFVYEDLEKQGFKNKVYVANLKVKAHRMFTLTFTEKKRSTTIRSNIYMASEISSQQAEESTQIRMPRPLKDLVVVTNDTFIANKLLEGSRTSSIIKRFRNVDAQGRPFMSIKIVKGVLSLEFYSGKTFEPNIPALKAKIASIENYLKKLVVLINVIQE